jgi:hypothetical protein
MKVVVFNDLKKNFSQLIFPINNLCSCVWTNLNCIMLWSLESKYKIRNITGNSLECSFTDRHTGESKLLCLEYTTSIKHSCIMLSFQSRLTLSYTQLYYVEQFYYTHATHFNGIMWLSVSGQIICNAVHQFYSLNSDYMESIYL